MTRVRRPSGPKDAEALRHDHATRRNIPTAEFQSIMRDEDKSPVRLDRGRVARPFGFALTDPGVRLSRTRLLLKVTRVMFGAASMGA